MGTCGGSTTSKRGGREDDYEYEGVDADDVMRGEEGSAEDSGRASQAARRGRKRKKEGRGRQMLGERKSGDW